MAALALRSRPGICPGHRGSLSADRPASDVLLSPDARHLRETDFAVAIHQGGMAVPAAASGHLRDRFWVAGGPDHGIDRGAWHFAGGRISGSGREDAGGEGLLV